MTDTGTEVQAGDISFVAGAPPTSNEKSGSDITFIAGQNTVYEVYGIDKSFVPKSAFAGDIHIDQLIYRHTDRLGG